MPARPVVAGVVSVTIQGLIDGTQEWVNKFHVSYAGGAPVAADMNTYCTDLLLGWVANMAALQHTSTTVEAVSAVDLASMSGAVGEAVGSAPGTRAGAPVPSSTAFVVGYHIARRYRGGHPRSYLTCGISSDLANQQQWSDAFQLAVGGGFGTFWPLLLVAAGAFAPVDHVNVSYVTANAPRLVPVVDVIAASGVALRKKIGTQRRRLG